MDDRKQLYASLISKEFHALLYNVINEIAKIYIVVGHSWKYIYHMYTYVHKYIDTLLFTDTQAVDLPCVKERYRVQFHCSPFSNSKK